VIEPLSFTTTFVAGAPPTKTVADGENPAPVIVTDVAPAVGPEAGDIEDIDGVGLLDVSKNSDILLAPAAAPGNVVSLRASADVRNTF